MSDWIPVNISREDYAWFKSASERTGIPVARLVRHALTIYRNHDGARFVEVLTEKGLSAAASAE
jgi:hypothetical protein